MPNGRLLPLAFIALGIVYSITCLLLLFSPRTILGIPDKFVEIKNLQFVPIELVVAAGTTITWRNLDPDDHDITSGLSVLGRQTRDMKQTKFPDGKFASGLFGKGKTFSVTLEEKGEYKYYCNIQPFMIAKIVVK